ncbi:MAG: PIN domain-containing protein [Treponema sp.]|nr:PIN domain-containing protein [Candidatus Treponema equifaecale]
MKNTILLVDTNIFIDILQERHPFIDYSLDVVELVKLKKLKGFVAAHSITNLWYILRKTHSQEQRRALILSLFQFFEIISLDKAKLITSLQNSKFKDFEDCLQDECAYSVNADYIITRNTKDFEGSKIRAVTPEEFLKINFCK